MQRLICSPDWNVSGLFGPNCPDTSQRQQQQPGYLPAPGSGGLRISNCPPSPDSTRLNRRDEPKQGGPGTFRIFLLWLFWLVLRQRRANQTTQRVSIWWWLHHIMLLLNMNYWEFVLVDQRWLRVCRQWWVTGRSCSPVCFFSECLQQEDNDKKNVHINSIHLFFLFLIFVRQFCLFNTNVSHSWKHSMRGLFKHRSTLKSYFAQQALLWGV